MSGGPIPYQCLAGLHDLVAAIRVSGFTVGYLLAGQYRLEEVKARSDSKMARWNKEVCTVAERIGVNPDQLWECAQETRAIAATELESIGEVLAKEAESLAKTCWHNYARRVRDELWQRLGRELTPKGVQEVLCDAVQHLFGPVSVAVLLPRDGKMVAYATREISPEVRPQTFAADQGLIGWTAHHQKALLAEDLDADSLWVVERGKLCELPNDCSRPRPAFRTVGSNAHLRSALTVPLGEHKEGLAEGVLQVGSSNLKAFAADDVAALQWVGEPALRGSKRARQFQAEYESTTGREELRRLRALLTIAIDTLDADYGDICVLSPESSHLQLVAAIGPLEKCKSLVLPAGRGLRSSVIDSGTTVICRDLEKEPEHQRYWHGLNNRNLAEFSDAVKSTVKIPLRDSSYTIIGMLCLQKAKPSSFKLACIAEAEVLAGLCAQVLEQWLWKGRELQLEATERFLLLERYELISLKDRQRVRQRLLTSILDVLAEMLPARFLSIWRYGDSPGKLTSVDTRGERFPVSPEQSLGDRLLEQGYRSAIRAHGAPAESVLCEDILVGEEPLYVVVADSLYANAFSSSAAQAFSRMAEHASLVIEHFYDREVAAFREALEREIKRSKAGGHGLRERLCSIAVPRIAELLGADGCSLWMKEDDRSVEFAAGLKEHTGKRYGIGQGVTGWILKHGRPVRVHNVKAPSELEQLANDLAWSHTWSDEDSQFSQPVCFLGAPVISSNEVDGVLRVSRVAFQHPFTLEDELCLTRLAHCFGELCGAEVRREFAKELAGLDQLDRALNENVGDRERICSIVLSHAKRLAGFDSGHVRLFDPARSAYGLVASQDESFMPPQEVREGWGVSGRVAESRTPWFVETSANNSKIDTARSEDKQRITRPDRHVSEYAHWKDTPKAIAVLPITVSSDVLGTMSVQRENIGPIVRRDRKCLQRIAERAAEALNACQLKDQIDRLYVPLLQGYDSLATQLGSADTGDPAICLELSTKILHGLHETIAMSDTVMYELTQDFTFLTRTFAEGPNAVRLPERISADDCDIARALCQLDTPWASNDPRDFPGFREACEKHEGGALQKVLTRITAFIIVPVTIEGNVDGIIATFDTRTPQHDRASLNKLMTYLQMGAQGLSHVLEVSGSKVPARSVALLATLLRGVAHVFGTPQKLLSPAICALMRESPDSIDKADIIDLREAFEEFNSCIEELSELKYHRLEQIVNLTEQVKWAIGFSQARPDASTMRVTPTGLEREVHVRGSSILLRTLFVLLLDNAHESYDQAAQGEIIVCMTTDEEEGTVTIKVEDHGRGIAENVKRNIWRAFYTDKKPDRHAGTGLAAVEAIRAFHNAHITLNSELRAGTTVEVTFSLVPGR